MEYLKDETLYISKKNEKEIIKALKRKRLMEIELLDYSINNLSTQLILINKMVKDKVNSLDNRRKEYIEKIKKEINPDLLCQICFSNRIDIILTPCGHTFCSDCIGDSKECFNCRGSIEKSYKVFT